MKNLILLVILIAWLVYYFVPPDAKIVVIIFDKTWIENPFLSINSEIKEPVKWELVKLHFGDDNKDKYIWNISNWLVMENLSWASLAYTKCFYPENYKYFDWNLVLHRVVLLKNKDISVKLTEEWEENKLSMYVYKTEALSKVFPPEKNYVHDCAIDIWESDERIIEMDWNTAPSDIVIWITWMSWALDWWYTLEVEQK
jgi:hypothetical protein